MSRGTPQRGIRIDDELWDQVKSQSSAEGINVSDLIRELLRGWLDKHQDKGVEA